MTSMAKGKGWKRWLRRGGIGALFAALVVVLLWFQGILFRAEPEAVDLPQAPRVGAADRLARVERRSLPTELVFPGFVEAVDPADVAPRVMATILELGVREGDPVRAGEVLAVLDDRDARARLSQAEAALDGARAQREEAELAFARVERLHEVGASTTQEWEAVRAARSGAGAQEERARQAVEEARAALSWFRLEAPFDGVVLERRADPGQLALPGAPLLALYRADRLRFRVAVPEERAGALAQGTTCALEFEGLGTRASRVTRVLPSSDPATGTVTLHLELTDAAGLRPGLLGRLRLAVGEREALVVPAGAVERIGQIERVGLVREGRIEAVTVRTGKRHADAVEVLSGLAEGEEVRLP